MMHHATHSLCFSLSRVPLQRQRHCPALQEQDPVVRISTHPPLREQLDMIFHLHHRERCVQLYILEARLEGTTNDDGHHVPREERGMNTASHTLLRNERKLSRDLEFAQQQ